MQKKKAPSTVSVHAIMLMGYDLVMLAIVSILLLVFYPSSYYPITRVEALMHYLLAAACMLGCRAIGDSYNNVWRYGGNNLYVNLICYDALAGAVYYVIQKVLPLRDVEFLRAVTLFALNLLGDILMRQIYQYLYDANSRGSKAADFLRVVTQKLTGIRVEPEDKTKRDRRINIAIIGAGRVGAGLAADLASNPDAAYTARFFVDIDRNKIGRSINGVPVFSEEEANSEAFRDYNIQEIVFAIPGATAERKKELYTYYKQTGCKLKTYDYPTTQSVNGKRSLRDFDAEELLFRQATEILSEDTKAYYRGKTVLISGGGGSIGSELCRQIAKIGPKRLVVLDVYENGAYDVQQELKIKHGKDLDLCVEIVTITDKGQLERVFRTHRPDVVIHAAAHKHVPLMELSPAEAIKNNVFGTRNLLESASAHGVERLVQLSTDKAVNPTNVMGATKRITEMLIQRYGEKTNMKCMAVRFGNVLGSHGSVIPLMESQIRKGGPVTVTHPDITRYFMTIPEAAQLVLQAGGIARSGSIFVLDMGEPVRIMDLAKKLIRAYGYEPNVDMPIKIIGLRPGEKLYEELLMDSERDKMTRTAHKKIFVANVDKIDDAQYDHMMQVLQTVEDKNDERAVEAIAEIVPTYHPDEKNRPDNKAELLQKNENQAAG